MRMRIEFGDPAMRCPAGVTDAHYAAQALRLCGGLHFGNTADAAHALDCPVENRDAGGIIAAIFQPAQALRQEGNNISIGDCADDATHLSPLKSIRQEIMGLNCGPFLTVLPSLFFLGVADSVRVCCTVFSIHHEGSGRYILSYRGSRTNIRV